MGVCAEDWRGPKLSNGKEDIGVAEDIESASTEDDDFMLVVKAPG
jgi:hypothetical protein